MKYASIFEEGSSYASHTVAHDSWSVLPNNSIEFYDDGGEVVLLVTASRVSSIKFFTSEDLSYEQLIKKLEHENQSLARKLDDALYEASLLRDKIARLENRRWWE